MEIKVFIKKVEFRQIDESNLKNNSTNLRHNSIQKRFLNTQSYLVSLDYSDKIIEVVEENTNIHSIIDFFKNEKAVEFYSASSNKYGKLTGVAYLDEFGIDYEIINPDRNIGIYNFELINIEVIE